MSGFSVLNVHAATITSQSDVLSSLKVSTAANHTITFTTPSGVGSGETITVTFPAGFNMGSVDHTEVDLTDDGVDVAIAATASGSTWGASVSGQVLTLTNGTSAVAADSVIEIEIGTNATADATGDQQITNPSGADTYTLSIAGTFGDTGDISVTILTDDQVSVSATVAQSVTFSISDNAIGYGTLTTANARYATGDATGSDSETSAHNLVAGTNAGSGYNITVQGATLTDASSNTITAIGGTAAASNPGSEQFGIRLTASGGSGSVSAPYATANYAYAADGSTSDEVASASGSTANTTYSVFYLANIASNTEAGEYSAALTYVATANF